MALSFHDLPPPVIFTHDETLHSIALPPLGEFLTGIDTTDRILKLHDILQRFRTPKSYHRVDERFVESSELPPKSPVAQRHDTLQDAEPVIQSNGAESINEVNGNDGEGQVNGHVVQESEKGGVELTEEEKRERGWPVILPEGMSKADYLLGPEPPDAVDLTDNPEPPQAQINEENVNGDLPPVNGEDSQSNGDGLETTEPTNLPLNGIHDTPAVPSQVESAQALPNGAVKEDPEPPSPIPSHQLPPSGPRRRIRELRLDLRTLDAAALFALETWRRESLGLEKLQLQHPDSVWYDDQAAAAESSATAVKRGRGRSKKSRDLENGATPQALQEVADGQAEGSTIVEDVRPAEEDEESEESEEVSVRPPKDDSASEYDDDQPRPRRPRPAPVVPVEVNGDAPKRTRGRPRKIGPEEVKAQQADQLLMAGAMGPESPPTAGEVETGEEGGIQAMEVEDGAPALVEDTVDINHLEAFGPDGLIDLVIDQHDTSRRSISPKPHLDLSLESSQPRPQQSPVLSEGEPELDWVASEDPDQEDYADPPPVTLLDDHEEPTEIMDDSYISPAGISQDRKGKVKAEPKKDSSNFAFPSASLDDFSFNSRTRISPTMDFDIGIDTDRPSPSRIISPRKRIRVSTDHTVLLSSSRRRTLEAVVIPVRTKQSRTMLRAEAERTVRFASPPRPTAPWVPLIGPSFALSPDESDEEVEMIEPDEWRREHHLADLVGAVDDDEAVLERMDSFMWVDLGGAVSADDLDGGDSRGPMDSIDEIGLVDGPYEWAHWGDLGNSARPAARDIPIDEMEDSPALEFEGKSEPDVSEPEPVLVTGPEDVDDDEASAADDEWSFLR